MSMKEQEIVKYCIDALILAGAQKAECLLQQTEKHELTVYSGEVNLFRTTYDTTLHLTGILDHKEGSLTANKLDQPALDRAVQEVIGLANASQADEAYDIAEFQPPKTFQSGPDKPARELMYEKLMGFLDYAKATFPNTIQNEAIFDFTSKQLFFQNSNGVNFVAQQGTYNFETLFNSKKGEQTSSFNYTGFSTHQLDKNLHAFGSVDTLLRQSEEQITTSMLPEKFVGDVIITPDCAGDFIHFITWFLGDYLMISGNSIFKDKLHECIADEQLTLHSKPVTEEMADGYFITNDGYEAQNSTIIENGVLRTFLLSLYGSRKTGKQRAVNDGGAYAIEPGKTPFSEMIRSVSRGILLGRFSGDSPSENGDFSGVAKNSYYIENGEIQYPLSETMISGNLATLLKNIRHISQERIHFGTAIVPWIQVGEITISGK